MAGRSSVTSRPLHVRCWLLLTALAVLGCGSQQLKGKTVVDEVRLTTLQEGERTSLDPADAETLYRGIATRQDETFDEEALALDLKRIETYFQGQGYYSARVVAARVVDDPAAQDPKKVRVEVEVHEGLPVTVAPSRSMVGN